jgi:hypothetical protein
VINDKLEAIAAALPRETVDEEVYRARFAAALDQRRPPAWMHELLLEADLVAGGLGTRFIPLPRAMPARATRTWRRSSPP